MKLRMLTQLLCLHRRKFLTTQWGTQGKNPSLFTLCSFWCFILEQFVPPQPQNQKSLGPPVPRHCPTKPYYRMQWIIFINMDPSLPGPSITLHRSPAQLPAPAGSHLLLPPNPLPVLSLFAPHSLLHPGPSASTSSARQSTAWALLAQHQAWVSNADTIRRHSKALCHVDSRAVKQTNPCWPCEGLAEVIHARSGGSWSLQNNVRWHAFCWGWEAGYGGEFLLICTLHLPLSTKTSHKTCI